MENRSFLQGRVACITGGITGQGLAVARLMALRGARLVLGSFVSDASEAPEVASSFPGARHLQSIRAELEAISQGVIAQHLDVRDQASIDKFVGTGLNRFGKIDILVNAAGVTVEQDVCGHSDELWHRVIDTNLTGAFRMIRECLPIMKKHGWGRIVNIGSTAATVGWKDNPAYCASKAGLLGLTRCVALEGAPHGVSCVMVSPTWVETGLMQQDLQQLADRDKMGRSAGQLKVDIKASNPQNRLIQPREVAELVVHLCREQSFGITGENVRITGGALW